MKFYGFGPTREERRRYLTDLAATYRRVADQVSPARRQHRPHNYSMIQQQTPLGK